MELLRANQTEQAKLLSRKLCRQQPNQPDNWLAAGAVAYSVGDLATAESGFRRAVALAPSNPQACFHLGMILQMKGETALAMELYRRAIAARPDFAEALNNLAALERAAGRPAEAERLLRAGLATRPGEPTMLNNLGLSLRDLGRLGEAENAFQGSLAANPRYVEAAHNLAGLMVLLGRLRDAELQYRRACEINPSYLPARIGLAESLVGRGENSEALEHYDRVLAAQPNQPEARAGRSRIFEKTGEFERAWQELAPFLSEPVPNASIALAVAALAKQVNRRDDAIASIERVLTQPAMPMNQREDLLYALGDLRSGTRDYDAAFAAYRDANAVASIQQPEANDRLVFEKLRSAFDPALSGSLPKARVPSSLPVFIVGMPRSGTSLAEQILAAHPAVYGGGELPWLGNLCNDFPQILGAGRAYPDALLWLAPNETDVLASRYLDQLRALAPNALRITDKMPHNFLHLGLVAMLFPEARVIHCRRDPRDTCLSIYFHRFNANHPYANDLARLGRYYCEYASLMQFWKDTLALPIFDLDYETLVEDFEGTVRRMLEFCGLEWHPACLDFHRSGRTVVTPSYDQVRQPLYKTSVGRWQRYAAHLAPLTGALENCGK
jgi:tetratricopeptide (TPR) repeat protein